jgi:hypothetical protein
MSHNKVEKTNKKAQFSGVIDQEIGYIGPLGIDREAW